MSVTPEEKWTRFQQQYTWFETLGLGLDFSRSMMPNEYADQIRPAIDRALADMLDLEAGAIANPDEERMVGHYWLRNPALAPTDAIRRAIEDMVADVKRFAAEVHSGIIRGERGSFTHILLIGIGGSALGPQFVSHALSHPTRDKIAIRFMDNTDPDGFDRILAELDGKLGQTLCVVVSKSGGTKETRNAMVEVEAAYGRAGIRFARHAVAITTADSELATHAARSSWLRQFPMWDWVGGRTSQLSAVGLVPAALQGIDIEQLIAGAKESDNATRFPLLGRNPALQLAVFIHYIGKGVGAKAMVVLPYKDRLELFSRYLQQLVMESLGKAWNRNGEEVQQGLTVFGNKGSTDQHAYVQQLRDGLPNFFCLFLSVLEDREGASFEVEKGITSGDYLIGFLLGTRDALFERGRESALLTLLRVDEFRIGMLIALFERTVGFYASLIDVNAYHQPGVEAGKKAAAEIIKVQQAVLSWLSSHPRSFFRVRELAQATEYSGDCDDIFRICEHLVANSRITGKNLESPQGAEFGSI